MQRSTNQKILLVLSIIEIVFAAIGIIFGVLALAGGAMLGGSAGTNDIAVNNATLTNAQVGGIAIAIGVVVLVAAIIDLVLGILGVRAANDNQKIKPVWVLAIVELVIVIISIIMTFANGGDIVANLSSSIVSLVLAVIMVVIANNIKKEAFGVAVDKADAED